jgi:O-acetyl-ADP-ribose deacetylase (regulator of RNase III)
MDGALAVRPPDDVWDRIEIVQADITKLSVESIVNAASESLLGGVGVCGAIHNAAGPELRAACAALGGCRTGDAKLTRGYGLNARFVIHAVGPAWRGGSSGEARLLASCYSRSLALAGEHGIRTIAFPCISTGRHGFPMKGACRIAVRAIASALGTSQLPVKVTLCAISPYAAAALASTLNEITPTPRR